jgi:hypothetical protein
VACVSCGSQDQATFRTEIAIHSRGLHDPLVFIYPEILVCMNCGKPQFAEEFVVLDNELRLLSKRGTASA